MIECLEIENFVILHMFRPYMPSLLPGEFQGLKNLKHGAINVLVMGVGEC